MKGPSGQELKSLLEKVRVKSEDIGEGFILHDDETDAVDQTDSAFVDAEHLLQTTPVHFFSDPDDLQ